MQPIIIAGFGRSGTTWVSDIISKTLGGLILFEPDHPCVFAESKKTLYSTDLNDKEIGAYLQDLLSKKIRNPWLLRNHLVSDETCPEQLLDLIWSNSNCIGFKCIRWNHALPLLSLISGRKLIFILRHPLAVVASLRKRTHFFKEFGWQEHWATFKKRNPLIEIDLGQYDHSDESIKYAAMWTITNIKALSDLLALQLPFWSYENIYRKPYEQSKEIMGFLGYENISLHPSYLFYPSMSTLKTFHTNAENWNNTEIEKMDFFYKKELEKTTIKNILNTVNNIADHFPSIRLILSDLQYLKD